MARLFVTAFILLLVSVIAATVGSSKIQSSLYPHTIRDFYSGLTRGTFDLLDESIAGLVGKELQDTVLLLEDRFHALVSLDHKNELNLPKQAHAILDGGGIYMLDTLDSGTVYRASKATDKIWSIVIDMDNQSESRTIAIGPLSLARDKFSGKDAKARSMALEQLQKTYDIPLSLHSLNELEFTENEIRLLNKRQVVVRNAGENGETLWIALDESDLVFQAGPFDYPAALGLLQAFLIASVVAMLFVGCLLWLWPLWRDLQRLRQASLAIGSGLLQTRVRTRQTSLIKAVLDGFNHMAARTENMVASQRELTSAVSHELRTPLARMMFDLEMAKDSMNTKDLNRHLHSLEFNVAELNTMVDELLTYAKQERVESPLELEAFTATGMRDWLDSLAARAKRSRDNHHTINVCSFADEDDIITFSPRLMAHATSNAIQNAMRFAAKTIVVNLEKRHSEWVISIEDDGPGIEPAHRERVFEPFSRLDESRQRDSGNFGLGLSIVRNIARWHHGHACIADCQSLSGTRVEIRWPVSTHL